MLHFPSMVTYGLLSFSMAFLNKALFEVADFRCSLFVILFQLIFVVVYFQLFGFLRLLSVPLLTRTEISKFLIPSIFYCLSTVLSLQALMKLNVAVYVVIKVLYRFLSPRVSNWIIFSRLALYTRTDVSSPSDRSEETNIELSNRFLCFCHYDRCHDYVHPRSFVPPGILLHRLAKRHLSISLPADYSTLRGSKIVVRSVVHQQCVIVADDFYRFDSLYG